MNSVWLEDLVALSECLNFSKAAERRLVACLLLARFG